MSTVTHLEPSRETGDAAPRARIVSGPLTLLSAASFAVLTSFYLLLSVAPLYAALPVPARSCWAPWRPS